MRRKLLFLCLFAALCATSAQAAFDADSVYNSMWRQLSSTGPNAYGPYDIYNSDGGYTDYYRSLWNIQELQSDEFICSWGDTGLPELTKGLVTPDNQFIYGFYARRAFSIFTTNYYLENASESLTTQRAEARLLRAMYYMELIDAFGDVPFATSSKESNVIVDWYNNVSSTTSPAKKSRSEIFSFIESELKACADLLPDDGKAQQYRPDKVAAWLLLARLYLNAEVYTGTARWADAKEYAKKVMDSSYTLCTNYSYLFMGDNDSNGAEKELILPIYTDGTNMQSYGAMTFVIASTYGSGSNGLNNNWYGNRLRENLVYKFFANGSVPTYESSTEMVSSAGDDRAMFSSENSQVENTDISTFTNGLECHKFTNLYSTGSSSTSTGFADTDIPLLRLAEAYLTYAEADARLNGGTCSSEGVEAYNTIRSRAHASTATTVTTDNILDEWAREFYGEGRRHTDLVRYGKYTGGDYLWPWKGGVYSGTALDSHYNLMPLPTQIMLKNEEYTQNAGYFDINTVHINKPFSLEVNGGKTDVIDLNSQDVVTIAPTGPTIEGLTNNEIGYTIMMVPQRYKGGYGMPCGTGLTYFTLFDSEGINSRVVSSELIDSCLYILSRAEFQAEERYAAEGYHYYITPKSLEEKDTLLVYALAAYDGKYLYSDTTQIIVQPYSPWQKDHATTYGGFKMKQPSYAGSLVELKKMLGLTFSWSNDVEGMSTDRTKYSLYMSTDGFKTDGSIIGTASGEATDITVNAGELSKTLNAILGYTLPSDIPQGGVTVSLYCNADNGYGVQSNSDTISVKLLPYYTGKSVKNSYLIGSSLGDAGWSNTGLGTSVIPMYGLDSETYDSEGKGKLSWTGYLDPSKGGVFQVLEGLGDWNNRIEYFSYSLNGSSYYHRGYDSDSFPIESSGLYTIVWDNANYYMTIDSYTGTSTVYSGMNVSVDGGNKTMNAFDTREGLQNHDWYVDLTFDKDASIDLTFATSDGSKSWTATTFAFGTATANASGKVGVIAGTYKLFFNDITGQYIFYNTDGTTAGTVQPTDEYGTFDVEEVSDIDVDNVGSSQLVQVCEVEPQAEGTTVSDYHILLGSDFSTDVAMTDNGEIEGSYLKSLANSGEYRQDAKRKAPAVEAGHKIVMHHAIPAKIYATYNDGEKEYKRLSDEFKVNLLTYTTVDLDSAYYYFGDVTNWMTSKDYKLQALSDTTHIFILKVEKGSVFENKSFQLMSQSLLDESGVGGYVSDWNKTVRPSGGSSTQGSMVLGNGGNFNLGQVPDGYDGYICTFDFDKMYYSFQPYNTNGINGVSTVKTATNDVYTISGQRVRKNASSLSGLPAGAYIVNGKVVIKK